MTHNGNKHDNGTRVFWGFAQHAEGLDCQVGTVIGGKPGFYNVSISGSEAVDAVVPADAVKLQEELTAEERQEMTRYANRG